MSLKDLAKVRIGSPEDVRSAAVALQNLVRQMGDWRLAICHNIASNRPMTDADGEILATSVFGWTLDDQDRWWRSPRLALDSPLPCACRYESEPFWCNAAGIYSKLPNPLLAGVDLVDFERRAMTHAAIMVPVHMPFGVIGAASISPSDRSHTDLSAEFEEYGDLLGTYVRTFVTSYSRFMVTPERIPVGSSLSKREVECLRWAAVGKTDLEIGMIMSRSRATVRFHIHNAATKLDAVNRSQTVFKAAQLGYIALAS